MGLLSAIGSFFTFWIKAEYRYQKIKSNEQKKDKSVSLGVRSIIQSIICGVLVVLFLWGLVACIGHLSELNSGKVNGVSQGLPIITILGMVFTAVGALVSFVQGVIGGLVYMIYQFKLNKRAIRWVALVIWVLVIIAIITLAIILFASL